MLVNTNIKSWPFTWNWYHFARGWVGKEQGIAAMYLSSYSDTIFLKGLVKRGRKAWWREREIISCIQPFSRHVLLYLEYSMHKSAVAFPGLAVEEQGSAFCPLQGAGTKPDRQKLHSRSADSSQWLRSCCERGPRLVDQVNPAATLLSNR